MLRHLAAVWLLAGVSASLETSLEVLRDVITGSPCDVFVSGDDLHNEGAEILNLLNDLNR